MQKVKSLALISSMTVLLTACFDNTSFVRDGKFDMDQNRTVEKVFEDYPHFINREWYESADNKNEIIFEADFSNKYLVDVSSPSDITDEQKANIVELLNKNKFKLSFVAVFTTDKKTFEIKDAYASYNDVYLPNDSIEETNLLIEGIIKKENILPMVTSDAAMAYSYYNLKGYSQNNENLQKPHYCIEYLADSYNIDVTNYDSFAYSPILRNTLKLDFDDENKRISYTIKTDATTVNDLAARLYGSSIYAENCLNNGVYGDCQFAPIKEKEFNKLKYDVLASKEQTIIRDFTASKNDTESDFGGNDTFRLYSMYKAAYQYPASYSEVQNYKDGSFSFNLIDVDYEFFKIDTLYSNFENDENFMKFLNINKQMDDTFSFSVALSLTNYYSALAKGNASYFQNENDLIKKLTTASRQVLIKTYQNKNIKLPPFIFSTDGVHDDVSTENKWGSLSIFGMDN